MEYKGFVSYANDNVNVLKNVYNSLDMRIQRITNTIGRVYLVDQTGTKRSIPMGENNSPLLTMYDKDGIPVLPYNDEFLFTVDNSFNVYMNGQMFIQLVQQKQHAIRAPTHITFFGS